MGTLLASRSGWRHLLTWITIVALFLPGCAKQKKGPGPPQPIPLPSVEISAIPPGKPIEPSKQTGPPPLLLPPSEELRSQMGKIRISDRRVQPEFEFNKPVGAGEGAMKGAGLGLGASLSGCGYGLILCAGTLALAPIFLVAGTYYGVQESQPEAKVEEFEQTFKSTIQKLEISQILRQQVADRIQALKVSEITGLSDPAAPITLEVVVKKIRLYHSDWFAPHILSFTGSTRLLRATDGKELYSHAFTTTGQQLPLAEWLAGDAAKLRQEIDRCCRELAELIVEEVFLLYLPEKNFLLYLPEKQKE